MTTVATRSCETCGRSIPAARLAQVPDARLCVDCQTTYESTHDARPHIDEGLAGSREEDHRSHEVAGVP